MFLLVIIKNISTFPRFSDFQITTIDSALTCGIKADDEEWNLQGKITWASQDIEYEKSIEFTITDENFNIINSICFINLTLCESPLNTTNGCHCSETISGSDIIYTINVRKFGTSILSSKHIWGNLFNLFYLTRFREAFIIETLPLVYNAVITTCTIDGQSVSLNSSSFNFNLIPSYNTSLVKCCVNNLITPYEVQISINGNIVSTNTNTPCVNTTITYDFDTVSSYNLKFDYNETGACVRRTDADNLMFSIIEDNPSSTEIDIYQYLLYIVVGLVSVIFIYVIIFYIVRTSRKYMK